MNELTVLKTKLNVGATAPFTLLHMTDTHIALDDNGQSHQRAYDFNRNDPDRNVNNYMSALKYAEEKGLTVLNTGDFFDFLSDGNFKFADEYLSRLNCIYAAGNHDFCHCVGQAKEDYAYKWEMIKRSAPHIPNSLYFYSRIINGVNIVTLDNSYYLMTEGQIELLKAEAARGLPIILGVHVPLYTPKLAGNILEREPCAYVMAAPEEMLKKYPDDRRIQQTPDEATLKAYDYICSEPMIKAVIAGHTHNNFEEELSDGKMQIVTHGTYAGFMRELEII